MDYQTAFTAGLEVVANACEDVVPPVYEALFKRYPDFEDLFVLDIDHGARGHMLNEALSMAEGLLDRDLVAHNFVAAERMNHVGYGIEDDVFEGFYTVMAETFQNIAGPAWTSDMGDAWREISLRASQAKL